jgi:hypothetical protein
MTEPGTRRPGNQRDDKGIGFAQTPPTPLAGKLNEQPGKSPPANTERQLPRRRGINNTMIDLNVMKREKNRAAMEYPEPRHPVSDPIDNIRKIRF